MDDVPLFDRIAWHEGMLLTPQHFQQESARVDALVGWQALAGQPMAWGVRRLEIDEARLGGGLLRVRLVEAVMPNGMAVRYDAARCQDATLELDLAEYSLAQGMAVHLVLGTARSMRQPGQPSMFRDVAGALEEDEVSEALAEEVPRMAPKLALVAGKAPGAAWISLQLMTLYRENGIVQRGQYWPAQLAVPASSGICKRAAQLAALMRERAVFLAQQSAVGAARVDDRLAMLEQRMRLASLVQQLPLLEATLAAPVVPPLALYLALCCQLGPLAALRPGTVPLAPPAYVHADSYAAFDTVLAHLQALAEEVSQEWRSVAFSDEGGIFTLPLRAEWLAPRLVVGLRGEATREMAQWLARATIGSRTVSSSLRDRRMLGARREPVEAVPALGLHASAQRLLFEVMVDVECIVAGQDLLIDNPLGDDDGRPQEIVLYIKG